MAETIEVKHTTPKGGPTGAGAAGSGGRGGGPIDEKKLAKAMAEAIDKVQKDAGKSLAKELDKSLDKLITKFAREMAKSQKPGQAGQKPISAKDIEQVLKGSLKNVVVETANSAIREASKVKPGTGHAKELEKAFKSMDKSIESQLSTLNKSISKKTGVELSSEGVRILSNAIGTGMRGVISKEIGNAFTNLEKTLTSAGRSFETGAKALESISKARKSGGGIEYKEVPGAIRDVIALAKEARQLKKDFTDLRASLKAFGSDQKKIVKELETAFSTELKRQSEKVKSLPGSFKDPKNFEKAFDKLENVAKRAAKIIDDAASEFERSAGTVVIAEKKVVEERKQVAKEEQKAITLKNESLKRAEKVTQEERKMITAQTDLERTREKNTQKSLKVIDAERKLLKEKKEIVKSVEKVSRTTTPAGIASKGPVVVQRPQPKIDAAPTEKVIEEYFKGVDGLIKQLLDKSRKEVERLIKIAEKSKTQMSSQVLEQAADQYTNFIDAVKSKDLPSLRKVAAKGVGGADVPGFEKLRKSIVEFETGKIEQKLETVSKKIEEGTKATIDVGKKLENLQRGKGDPTARGVPTTDEATRLMIKRVEVLNSKLRGPTAVSAFPERAIEPTTKGIKLQFEGQYSQFQEQARKAVESRVNELATSLVGLQKHIVTTLDKEFKAAGDRWAIVRKETDKSVQDYFKLVGGANLKTTGKQYGLEIADVANIRKELRRRGKGDIARGGGSGELVSELRKSFAEESAKRFKTQLPEKIAGFIKGVSEQQIKQWEGISKTLRDAFVEIKNIDPEGLVPSKKMVEAVEGAVGPDRRQLEEVFKQTAGKVEATRRLTSEKLVKTIALPAAKLTKGGAPVFETARGSQRGIPNFAKFTTGFEKIYDKLAKDQALILSKGFAEDIRKVGVRPRGELLGKAENLAKDMLTDYARVGEENIKDIQKHIRLAAKIRSAATGGERGVNIEKQIENVLKTPEISKNVDNFINAMEAAGVSAYDVVKAMDKIEFQNVYDIMQKVLSGAQGLQPLTKLGKTPQYEKSSREVDVAINQVLQSLPLVEPGRPRRAEHQSNVVNLLSRGGDIYSGEQRLNPEEQKDLIKDLNTRLAEVIKEGQITNQMILKEGMRTISSLGIPDAMAGNVEIYKEGKAAPGVKFLQALDAYSTKMSVENLPELAPFGAEFTNAARNISSVTAAMESNVKQLNAMSKDLGVKGTLRGTGTEFPGLRTTREEELISSGKYGTKGFGFNVLTELRHTAGTMEDQILVSGKLADALTSVTKVLIKPGGGRVGAAGAGVGVGKIQEGVVADADIKKVSREFQEVLGMKERYPGRADKALIDKVTKATTLHRGESIEVQQARLTEVFLNHFGRKFTTRYGSKGVAVTPTGLGEETSSEILTALKKFPEAKVKVLTPEQRGKAGLGVAVLPRSMGELLADLFEKAGPDVDKAMKELNLDGTVKELNKELIASGNKFVFDMFKAPGIVAKEEAERQVSTFRKVSSIVEKLGLGKLETDAAGIEQIRGIHKTAFGKDAPQYTEKPIDIRISSKGIAKRGLQPEFMEAVLNNIIGAGPTGATVVPTKFGQENYQKLLGTETRPGQLSEAAGALGFTTAIPTAKPEDLEAMLLAGKTDEYDKMVAKRGAAIEAMSNFYTTVLDEVGKQRKSIVGEKFVSIIEEPGRNPAWTKEDIRRGIKGVSVDIPSFSAYATQFGERSELLKEIKQGTKLEQKKNFEFIKALQLLNDEAGLLQNEMLEYMDRIDVAAVKYFEESTGVLSEQAEQLDPRNLEGTLFDVKRFPKPFFLDIPKTAGRPGETEPFYVPGALARGTYPEELIAGERGVEDIGRRLQHVVNMAKEARELLERPAELESEIEELEIQLTGLQKAGRPTAEIETKLATKKSTRERILSGEGAIPKVVSRRVIDRVSELLQGAQGLRKSKKPEDLTKVQEILQAISAGLSHVEAPEQAFRTRGGGEFGINVRADESEVSNVAKFLEIQLKRAEKDGRNQIEAYVNAVAKAADLLIGKGPKAQAEFRKIEQGIAQLAQGMTDTPLLEELRGFVQRKRKDPTKLKESLETLKRLGLSEIEATEDQLTRLGKSVGGGQGIELATRLGINIEQELEFRYVKKLEALQKSKIDYYNALAQTAIGKKGAIDTLVFSRKIPGVMQKAIAAVVDRSQELDAFGTSIQDIIKNTDPSLIDVDSLITAMENVRGIAEEHKKVLSRQRESGIPVLKQHEIGIPAGAAKKLPVKFTERFKLGEEGEVTKTAAKEQEGTLFDLLKYVESLEKATAPDQLQGFFHEEIKKELDQLAPFVESVRYPFTGISSLVPYKGKLLTGEQGRKAGSAFAVPGAPELDIEGLDVNLGVVRDMIESLGAARTEEFEKEIGGLPLDEEKVAKLTAIIEALSKAVSEATPKYAAHTAKLDFDGDEIVVHTAQTRKAREEIKRHYEQLSTFTKGTQDLYRDVFTGEALLSQAPSSDLILAEAAEKFYKKFPIGKQFEFLKKPYVTEELEYMKPTERLGALGLGAGGIEKALVDVVSDTIRGADFVTKDVDIEAGKLNKDIFIEAIKAVESPFKSLEEEAQAIKSEAGMTKRLGYAENVLAALAKMDQELATSFIEEVQKVLTSRLVESRYRDAVEANLFKIHTGVEVESIYRLGRVLEGATGFGGGFTGEDKSFRPSAEFQKKFPRQLKILGAEDVKGELVSGQPEREALTIANEIFRFAQQKGLDVKKDVGARPVAGEIERALAQGLEGARGLWERIEEGDETLDELVDFAKVNAKAIKTRIGDLPTELLRTELTTLLEARGADYSPAKITGFNRSELEDAIVEAVGIKGFLEQYALIIQQAAVDGLTKKVKQYSPEKRAQLGIKDIEAYSRRTIATQVEEGGIDIKSTITDPKLPLYSIRQSKNLQQQVKQYKEKYGELPASGLEFKYKSPGEVKDLEKKFKEARATAKNIQDALAESAETAMGGAYAELVHSTLENLHNEQLEIEDAANKLKTEGFDISTLDRSLNNLVQRVQTDTDIPEITEKITKMDKERKQAELERLANLVGVPTMTREEEYSLDDLQQQFRVTAEKQVAADKPKASTEEIQAEAEDISKKMLDKAKAVYEMDRILDVLVTKAREGIVLQALLPKAKRAETVSIAGEQVAAKPKSFAFEKRSAEVAKEGVAMREEIASLLKPPGGIGPGGGLGPGGYAGGVIPVHIHSIAQGIGLTLGGGGMAPGERPATHPDLQDLDDTASAMKGFSDALDKHTEVGLKNLQEKLESLGKKAKAFDRHADVFSKEDFAEYKEAKKTGKPIPQPFKILEEQFGELEDIYSYKGLKKKSFAPKTEDVFTGSALKGGGLKETDVFSKSKRREGQVTAITMSLLGLDDDVIDAETKEAQDAAFAIGTALHLKMQREIAARAKATGENVEIEKFVKFKPEETTGVITGFIDVARKNQEGMVDLIQDIKTTSETFAKFETISRLVPEEGIGLEELLENKDTPAFLLKKLRDYQSQLNTYMGALRQQGKAAENMMAEITFISSEDVEGTQKPRTVRFKFDPDKLREDMEALEEAREIARLAVSDANEEMLELFSPDVRKKVIGLRGIIKRRGLDVDKFGKKKSAIKQGRTVASLELEEALDKELGSEAGLSKTDEEEFLKLARQYHDIMASKIYKEDRPKPGGIIPGPKGPEQFTMRDPDIQRARTFGPAGIYDPAKKPGIAAPGTRERMEKFMPKPPAPDEEVIIDRFATKTATAKYSEAVQEQFANLKLLHEQTLLELATTSNWTFQTSFDKAHQEIQAAIPKGKMPISAGEFNELIQALEEAGHITFTEVIEAWKIYRVAFQDWQIAQAADLERAFEVAKDTGTGTREFGEFLTRVDKIRDFVKKHAGKRSDIYTRHRRFIAPELAEKAGVYQTPEELLQKTSSPFGPGDKRASGLHKDIITRLEAGELGAPADEVAKIVEELSRVNDEYKAILQDSEMFARMGQEAKDAWDFQAMSEGIKKLRAALINYMQLNLREDLQTDVIKKGKIGGLIGQLGQIDKAYSGVDLERARGGPYRPYESGAVKVPTVLPVPEQQALHRRNIQQFREFFQRPKDEGGPEIGEKFSYFARVVDQAGNVLKNTRVDFQKYGEASDEAGEKVGRFAEVNVDLIDKMQMAGGTFRSALKRVVMWGGAATLVYGGVQKLKESVSELADIEVSIAQLRMVMNPLRSDFTSLTTAAVGFAKEYGVSVNEVLKGMKIFAQQGLEQAEIIDRTRVSTLAANVTTLSAYEATEALTAAMKSFGGEVGSAMMVLDSWSETEAKHAITAGDMANAIKKSAAAAKNAGFTFNELNGIVAGIGAVTRQSGKEVGTAMRFIFRRLTSEKGPKSLGEIGIPTLTGEGELRRGFDILSDLSMKWADLTNAQRMNISQSIGGTRQYNSLLVAMDNWDEVLQAIEHSTNSKGSAERRNLEIMKTYTKQLEQMRAAATELKMEFGKIVFPIFKGAIKAVKTFFEVLSSIPTPIKVAGAAITLFLGYAAKGVSLFDKLAEVFNKGQHAVKNFGSALGKQAKIGIFEAFGQKKIPLLDFLGIDTRFTLDTKGLKTMAPAIFKDLSKMSKEELDETLKNQDSFFKKSQSLIDKYGEKAQTLTLATPIPLDDLIVGATRGASGLAKKLDKSFGKPVLDISHQLDDRPFFDQLKKFQSGIGKLAFTLKTLGDSYNTFLGKVSKGIEKGSGSAADSLDEINDKIQNFGIKAQAAALFIPGVMDDAMAGIVNIAGASSEALERIVFRNLERIGGAGARMFAESFAKENAGLFKSILPITATVLLFAPIFKSLYRGWVRAARGADDYAKAMHAVRDSQAEDIKEIRTAMSAYENLEKKMKSVVDTARRFEADPEELVRRVEYGEYKSPILELARVQDAAKKVTMDFVKANVAAIAGVDKFGNVILNNTDSIMRYAEAVEEARVKQLALTDVDILAKYMEDLTTEGSDFWREFGDFLSEMPLVGDIDIGRTPLRALDEITKRINDMISLKAEFPLVNVMDEQFNGLVDTLDKVRGRFGEVYDDMLKKLGEIHTKGLSRLAITELFTDPKLTGGFQLITEYESRIKNLPTEVQPTDVAGAEILKRVFPQAAEFIDVDATLVKEKAREAGFQVFEAMDKVFTGSIITFLPNLAEKFHIAGNYAVTEMDEAGNMVVTFFDEYAERLTSMRYDDPQIQAMVDGIIPVKAIMDEVGDRINALNAFITGAEVGILGIDEKRFKREFSLGTKFFSDIATTTLLQTPRGYTPGAGYTQESPLKLTNITGQQENFASVVKKFFIEPMEAYNAVRKSYDKSVIPGLDKSADVTKTKFDEIMMMQRELANNQVAIQYMAVFVELTKTLEAGTRALGDNLAAEKLRLDVFKTSAGFMKGFAEGLDALDTGIRKRTELTTKQRSLLEVPAYGAAGGQLRQVNVVRDSRRQAAISTQSAITQMGQLRRMYDQFGVTIDPEDMKQFAAETAATGEPGFALVNQGLRTVDKSIKYQTGEIKDFHTELLAAMGDADSVRELAAMTQKEAVEKGPVQMAVAIDKLAGQRKKAEETGDVALVAQLDRSLNVLSRELYRDAGPAGVKVLASDLIAQSNINTTEIMQRAFSGFGVGMAQIMDRLAAEKPGAPKGDIGTYFSGGIAPLPMYTSPSLGISGSKEYKALAASMAKTNDIGKEGLLNTKNLLKGAAAFIIFEQFNKSATSKQIRLLEENLQAVRERYSTAVAGGGGKAEPIAQEIAGITAAIASEERELKMHQLALTFTKLTAGSTQLARILGVNEKMFALAGGSAATLYLTLKSLGGLMGTDIKQEAGELESALAAAGQELLKGDITKSTGARLQSAAEEFENEYTNWFDKKFGKTPKKYQEEVQAGYEKAVKEGRTVSTEELFVESQKQLKKTGASSAQVGNFTKTLVAVLGASLVGYANQKLQASQDLVQFRKLSEEQSKLFAELLAQFPDETKVVFERLYKQMQEAAAQGDEKLLTQLKQRVLNTGALYDEMEAKLQLILQSEKDALVDIGEEAERLQNIMAGIELFQEIKVQLEQFQRDVKAIADDIEIRSEYAAPVSLNRGLRGFPGDVALPTLRREMGPQQRLFAGLNEAIRETLPDLPPEHDVRSDQQIAADQANVSYNRFIGSVKESITAYQFAQQVNDRMVKGLIDLRAKRRELLENEAEEGVALDLVNSGIEYFENKLTELNSSMQAFGESYRLALKFTESINKLNDSLSDLSVQETIEDLESFRQYREGYDRLLGGGHPLAPQITTPQQQIEAARGGTRLGPLATRYEVERADIMRELRTATGDQRRQLLERFTNLPETQARDIYQYEQKQEIEQLRRQAQIFENLAYDLERLAQTEGVAPGQATEFRDLRDAVIEMLRVSREVEVTPEGKFFKGFKPEDIAKVQSVQNKISEELLRQAPTLNMQELGLAVSDPITEELRKQTEYLKAIATEMLGEERIAELQKTLEEREAARYEAERYRATALPDYDVARTGEPYYRTEPIYTPDLRNAPDIAAEQYARVTGGDPYTKRELERALGPEGFKKLVESEGVIGQTMHDVTGGMSDYAMEHKAGAQVIAEYTRELQKLLQEAPGLQDRMRAAEILSDPKKIEKYAMAKEYGRPTTGIAGDPSATPFIPSYLRYRGQRKGLLAEETTRAEAAGKFREEEDVRAGFSTPEVGFFEGQRLKHRTEQRRRYQDREQDKMLKEMEEESKKRREAKEKALLERYRQMAESATVPGFAVGSGKASGGPVYGKDGPDQVPAYLTAGEYVVKKQSVDKLGLEALEYINETGKVPKFGMGGMARKRRHYQVGGDVPGPVAWLAEQQGIELRQLSFRDMDKDDIRNFAITLNSYIKKNPIVGAGFKSGALNFATSDSKYFDMIDASDATAVYDRGLVVVNTDLWKDVRDAEGNVVRKVSPKISTPWSPKGAIKDPIKYVLAHEYGHAQDSLIRGAIDSWSEANPDLSANDLPEYVKNMMKAMTRLSDSKTAVSGYAADTFKKKGVLDGLAENLADTEAISELGVGDVNKKLRPVVEAYTQAFSAENQEKFVEDFAEHFGNLSDLNSFSSFAGGGQVEKGLLGTAWEYYFGKAKEGDPLGYGKRLGQGQKGVSGYLKPGAAAVYELEKLLELDEKRAGGMIKRRRYAAGGPVDDEEGVKFGETTAMKTSIRVAREFLGLHRERMQATDQEIGDAKKRREDAAKAREAAKQKKFPYEDPRDVKLAPEGTTLPTMRAADDRGRAAEEAKRREETFQNITEASPDEIRRNIGNVRGDLSVKYNKARYILEHTPSLTRPENIQEEEELKKSAQRDVGLSDPYHAQALARKADWIRSMLVKPDWTPEERKLVSKMLTDVEIDTKFGVKRKEVMSEKYGGLSDPVGSYFVNPTLFEEYKQLLKQSKDPRAVEGGEVRARLAELREQLESGSQSAQLIRYRSMLQTGAKAQTAKRYFDSLTSRANIEGTDTRTGFKGIDPARIDAVIESIKMQLREQNLIEGTPEFKRAFDVLFGQINPTSLPVKHAGGRIAKTGPVFAQKGEYILPAKFQEAGFAAPQAAATLNAGMTVRLEGVENLIEELKSVLDNAKIEIDTTTKVAVDVEGVTIPVTIPEDATVKVDTEGVSVPVDITGVSVPIDVEGIAEAVSDALSRVSADTGAVGADDFDKLQDTIDEVHDKIIALSARDEEITSKLEMVDVSAVKRETLTADVNDAVQVALGRINQDIDNNRNDINNLSGQMITARDKLDYELRDTKRTASEALDYATRN